MHQIHESLLSLAVSISTLNHDPANARLHDARNLDAIRASLAKFGQRKPIVVQRQGMVVRAGNGTLDAARSLGWTDIAAVVVDEGDVEATAFGIADNRSAELAKWDDGVLGKLLTSLPFDLALTTGFNSAEMAAISKPITVATHGRAAVADVDPDEIPEQPIEPMTKKGNLWVLGQHRLLCGDSTIDEDVARVMAGERAVLMATDPPYGIAYDNQARGGSAAAKPAIANDDLVDGPELQAFLEKAIRAAVPHLDERCAFYLWHPMLTQGTFFAAAAAAAAADILIHRQIIWVKPSLLLGRGDYHWRHELCFYGWRRGNRPPFYGERDQDTIWEVASVSRAERKEMNHATPKPVALWDRPIANHTRPGEVLYEPFAGSGAQVIAAERSDRRCFAIELDPANCDVIVRRWEKLTGLKGQRKRA